MQQINPAETFPIVRVLTDHTDATTYYVRAVIKNATDDSVLATLDMVEEATRYFRYNWKVIYDNVMSRGKYITITTSVYTSNAYTTKSDNYGDELETYLVQERWDPYKLQGLGGGGGLGEKDMKKLMREMLGELKFPKQNKFPKQTEYGVTLGGMSKEIAEVKKIISSLPSEHVSLEPIVVALANLTIDVKNKPVTPITNLASLSEAIKEAQKERSDNKLDFTISLKALEEKLIKTVIKIVEEAVQKTIPGIIQKNMEGANFTLPLNLTSQMSGKEDRINKLKKKFGV